MWTDAFLSINNIDRFDLSVSYKLKTYYSFYFIEPFKWFEGKLYEKFRVER